MIVTPFPCRSVCEGSDFQPEFKCDPFAWVAVVDGPVDLLDRVGIGAWGVGAELYLALDMLLSVIRAVLRMQST